MVSKLLQSPDEGGGHVQGTCQGIPWSLRASSSRKVVEVMYTLELCDEVNECPNSLVPNWIEMDVLD